MSNQPASESQKSKLYELMLSSTFTAAEAQLTYHWIENAACTRETTAA